MPGRPHRGNSTLMGEVGRHNALVNHFVLVARRGDNGEREVLHIAEALPGLHHEPQIVRCRLAEVETISRQATLLDQRGGQNLELSAERIARSAGKVQHLAV